MHKALMIIAAGALLAGGSLLPGSAKAGTAVHHNRISHHVIRHGGNETFATRPANDITSFSSSSVLHIGVNHPPKNR